MGCMCWRALRSSRDSPGVEKGLRERGNWLTLSSIKMSQINKATCVSADILKSFQDAREHQIGKCGCCVFVSVRILENRLVLKSILKRKISFPKRP